MIANSSSNYQEMQTGASAHTQSVGGEGKCPYYGKCQYKTGKCFNERTLKRNGDAHSLCEEHRIKQNLIQRRSDRKYQTVHTIRRRERSQRRAVLKKQVSMAVAQQLFYEHQQQKSIGIQQLSAGHPLSTLAPAHSHSHGHAHAHAHSHSHAPPHGLHHALHSVASLAPPIQIPGKMGLSHFIGAPSSFLSSAEGLASPILSFAVPAPTSSSCSFMDESSSAERDHKMDADDNEEEDEEDEEEDDSEQEETSSAASLHKQQQQLNQSSRYKQKQLQRETTASDADHVKEEKASPTGIDDFAPDSFLSICASEEESDAAYANLVPIMSTMGEEMWTEDDIEFLQNLLLA